MHLDDTLVGADLRLELPSLEADESVGHTIAVLVVDELAGEAYEFV